MKKLSLAIAFFVSRISAEENFTARGPYVGDVAVTDQRPEYMSILASQYDCNINEVSVCWKDSYICAVYWGYENCPLLRGTTTKCPDLIS
jgi:hypothetical protein